MHDKTPEEKANLAKKLAEQRAKGIEGIPTTAKVRHNNPIKRFISYLCLCIYLSVQLFYFKICSSKLMNLSSMSMRSKTLSLQQTFLVNYIYLIILLYA